jgi:ribosomal protein L7Ae-like RNA K-turn-binding protein
MKAQLSKYLGLCAASRSAVCGSELALSAVRKNPAKVYLMILAQNASARTEKQITDKCAYYKVKLIKPSLTMEELSDALGKSSLCAACAITNKGLAEKIEELTTHQL